MAVLKYKKKDGSYATLTNISIKPIEPVQTTGSSTTDVMSQAAVTTELAQKLAVSDFNTYSGTVDASIAGKASQSDLNTLSGTVTAHTADSGIHVTASDKTSWNDAAANSHTHSNKSIIDGITGSVGTMAYENISSYSSATEISAALGNKVDKVEGKGLSTEDYTSAEKTKLGGIAEGAEVNVQADWNETATTADSYILNKPTLGTAAAKGVSTGITNSDNLIESKHIYSGVGVTISYDSESKYIELKSTSGNVLSSFDASSFIKDGMVDNVTISGGNLNIIFNTDAGKETISLPLTDIFNPSNYYTTAQTSGASEISTALAAKTDTATTTALNNVVTGHTANTSIHLSSTEKTNLDSLETNIAAISGITSTKVGNWDGAATNSHTHSNKSVLDGISSSDITNWNGKTSNVGTVTNVQLSLPTGLSASTTAITSSGTFDIALSNGYSIPTTTKQGQWDTAYTNNHTHGNKSVLDSITGSVGSMVYENTSSYSSATQVSTALSGKSNTGHTHTKSEITDFPSSMPASDVYYWAKAENKPTYTYSEVGAAASSHNHDDRYYTESELTGSSTTVVVAKAASATTAASATNAGYATSAGSAPASDVYSWAKASSKPSYSASEITGLGNSATLNTGTTAGTVAAGNHTHSQYLTGITSGDVTGALGYTPPTADTNTTYAAGSFVSITGSNNSINVTTGTSSSSVARGDHDHSGVYQPVGSYLTAITSSDVTTALGFTPMSNAMLQYSAVTVTDDLNNQVCPVTLTTNGQQCNVLYVNNATAHTVSISTDSGYVTPDGNELKLTLKANGYGEVNYLYYGGTIYARGV